MLALTELRDRSTLDEEFERVFELVLRIARRLSILDEDTDRLTLEALLVEMLAFTELSEPSMLEDELERFKLEVMLVEMLALTELSDASTLEDEFERLRLEV